MVRVGQWGEERIQGRKNRWDKNKLVQDSPPCAYKCGFFKVEQLCDEAWAGNILEHSCLSDLEGKYEEVPEDQLLMGTVCQIHCRCHDNRFNNLLKTTD